MMASNDYSASSSTQQTISSGQSASFPTDTSITSILVQDGGTATIEGPVSSVSLTEGREVTTSSLPFTGADITSGATIQSLSVGNNRIAVIENGATVSSATVVGGTELISLSGSALHTLVEGAPDQISQVAHQGTQIVQSGGVAIDTTVSAGYDYFTQYPVMSGPRQAEQIIEAGGSAQGTILTGTPFVTGGDPLFPLDTVNSRSYASAIQTVESGGSVSGTTVNGGGFSTIQSGATAIDTNLGGTSIQVVQQNWPFTTATVPCFGEQIVNGATYNVTVENNGILIVGGSASAVSVSKGGEVSALSGSTLSDISVNNGGTISIESGTILQNPVQVETGAAFVFAGVDNSHSNVSGTVVPETVHSGDTPRAMLEVLSAGTVVEEVEIAGDFTSPLYFTRAASGNYLEMGFGTPCYCPGTLIATPHGERPVENLEIGDPVLTAGGQIRPVHWIGRRAYDPLFAYGNRDVLPILIRAGALAEGLPRRDLMISPLHAMFIDGFLIPALHLVNGTSIIQIERPETIRYIHVELESHDLLLAEGAPSESFLDDGSRGMFHNAEEYRTLYPDAPDRTPRYCAPRLEGGAELEAIHRRLCSSAPARDDRAPTGAAA